MEVSKAGINEQAVSHFECQYLVSFCVQQFFFCPVWSRCCLSFFTHILQRQYDLALLAVLGICSGKWQCILDHLAAGLEVGGALWSLSIRAEWLRISSFRQWESLATSFPISVRKLQTDSCFPSFLRFFCFDHTILKFTWGKENFSETLQKRWVFS